MFRQSLARFFSNDNSRTNYGRILKEGFVVSVTEYAMLGSFVMINLLINHYYGTELVGIYALSYSIAQIGIMGIGSVFSLLMRRDLSINEFAPNKYLSKVQILRSSNLVIVLILATGIIEIFYPLLRPNLVFILLMICAKGFDALSESYYTAYQTLNRFREYSLFKMSNALAFLGVSVLICLSGFDIVYLYLGQAALAVSMFGVNYLRWHLTSYLQHGQTDHKIAGYRFLLVESFPLMVNALIFQLGIRANNILIFDKLGEKDLGVFSIVVITIGVFAGLGNTLAIVFFGRLSKSFVNDPTLFSRRLNQTIALFLVLGISCYVLYLIFTPILENLFGLAIDHDLYRIMSASLPFIFVTSCLGAVFTIIRRQRIGMYLSAVILVVNLSVYYTFTGFYGLNGAAYAFLTTAIFQCLMIYGAAMISVRRIIRTGS